MRLLMLGVNHRTASVEMREKLALATGDTEAMIETLRRDSPGVEAVPVSTCNRTEIYVAKPTHQPPNIDQLRALLAERGGVSPNDLAAMTIHREQDQALRHLFRVACGIDSMVLGETQVLGQVRRAYERATEFGGVGPVLHRAFQQALATAKRVRHETGIDAGRVSVASVAVDFARQIFSDFDDKTVLGIGAGEMAKTTLHRLQELKPRALWVVNRTTERAADLAEALHLTGPAGGVRAWDELEPLLVDADIVLTTTGSREPIVTADGFKPLLKKRRGRPLFIIDLAVPRDVDPAIGAMNNVYLYNIDDLQAVVARTHGQRTQEVDRCETMLTDAVRHCMTQIQSRDMGQLIRQLRSRLNDIGATERDRSLRKLVATQEDINPDALERVLNEHTHRLVNKILHLPLSQLDSDDISAPLGFYAAALRRLFDLDDAPPNEASRGGTEDVKNTKQNNELKSNPESELSKT